MQPPLPNAANQKLKFLNCVRCSPDGPAAVNSPVIGVLPGNGIGPEVIRCSLQVLRAVESALGLRIEVRTGGPIAEEAERSCGNGLPEAVIQFCEGIFAEGGAILSGPGGGRYVYQLRSRFDLFCKFVPIRPCPELARAGSLMPHRLAGTDLLIVRDNTAGIYQGHATTRLAPEGRTVEHCFSYSEAQVRRVAEVAVRAAAARRGRLHVVVKDAGVPAMSALWRDVAFAEARRCSVKAEIVNVDLAAYELIQHPASFDVLLAPNMIGDILADVAGALVASRGLTFSGNYNAAGNAVYQTNHGCAHDLAGTGRANPGGQILSMAMLLRESFGLDAAADAIERSLREAWRQGWRTEDIAETGCRTLGTDEFTDRITAEIGRLAELEQPA